MPATSSKSQDPVDELKADVVQLREDISQIGKSVGKVAEHGGTRSLEKAEDMLKSGQENSERAVQDLRGRIETNPMASCGIALGIGVVAGLLLARR